MWPYSLYWLIPSLPFSFLPWVLSAFPFRHAMLRQLPSFLRPGTSHSPPIMPRPLFFSLVRSACLPVPKSVRPTCSTHTFTHSTFHPSLHPISHLNYSTQSPSQNATPHPTSIPPPMQSPPNSVSHLSLSTCIFTPSTLPPHGSPGFHH